MSQEFTDKTEELIERIATMAGGGSLDFAELGTLVRHVVEIAEEFAVPGPKKRELALGLLDRLVDRFFSAATPTLERWIEDLDVPFLPESIERVTIDPVLLAWAPELVRPLLKSAMPALVDLVVDATKGAVKVNEGDVSSLAEQVDTLANYIMADVPGEPSQSQGAVDTAIRVMQEMATERTNLGREAGGLLFDIPDLGKPSAEDTEKLVSVSAGVLDQIRSLLERARDVGGDA